MRRKFLFLWSLKLFYQKSHYFWKVNSKERTNEFILTLFYERNIESHTKTSLFLPRLTFVPIPIITPALIPSKLTPLVIIIRRAVAVAITILSIAMMGIVVTGFVGAGIVVRALGGVVAIGTSSIRLAGRGLIRTWSFGARVVSGSVSVVVSVATVAVRLVVAAVAVVAGHFFS